MASSATKRQPIFDEIISLIRGLGPCPYGEAVAQDRTAALVEVGGACRAASLVLLPPQQRTVRDAFVAWASGYHGDEPNGGLNDSGVGNVGDKGLLRHRSTSSRNEQQARAQGLAAWRAFCPTNNWDAQSTNEKKMADLRAVDPKEVLVFTRGAGDATALLVPLSYCELDAESGLPRMSTKVETKAACIDATVQVGDLLACSSASPHLPMPAQVTALWPQQHEVEVTPLATAAATIVRLPGLTHGRVVSKRDGATMRVSVTSLLGVEVVRPSAVASLDTASHQEDVEGGDNYDDDSNGDNSSSMKEKPKKRLVCPAFTLPAADHLAALDLLRQRSARDAVERAKLAKAAKKAAEEEPLELAQRVRLLAALRASELHNRNEALRLLKLLDARRVSKRTEWQKVGRALCAASPDLLGAWQEWTQESLKVLLHVTRKEQVAVTSKDQQRRISSRQQHAEQPTSKAAVLPSAKECEEVWRHIFRPPTTVDYCGGEFVLPASSSSSFTGGGKGEGDVGTAPTIMVGASLEKKSRNFQEAWTMAGAAKRDYLRFVDPSNGRAVAVNASVVRDAPSVFTAQPSAHLPMPSAVVHVHQREEVNNGWVPAEVEVGDWVTTRSRVQLCFVRVVALNLDPRSPSITVAKPLNSRTQPSSLKHPPPGTSGWMANNTSTDEGERKNKVTKEQGETGASFKAARGPKSDYRGMENDEVQEVWHDLGLLWGAWVWRSLPGENTDENNVPDATHHGGRDRGLLWRLPCTAATTGLGELNAMADSDAKHAAAEAAALAAATAKDPRQTNAYYTTQTLHVPAPASTPAPKVVLVRRTADALTIGWALPKGTKLPVGSDKEAVVEVLVRVLKGGGDHDLSSSTYASRTIDEPTSRIQQTALLSTVWNGENTSGSGGRQKKSSQGTRARNKLANGLVATSSPLLNANDAAATTSTMKFDKKRVVNEWRELYRGDKNGCLVSQLSPGRTYSLRVRVGVNGRMTHVRLSTLPAPPPTPLVRRWAMVPRPNKDPRPSRERLLEVVLCGASSWHRHLKPPLTVQSQAAAEAPREAYHRSVPFVDLALKEGTRGTGRTGGAFGNSSTRFHGLRGGAQNGGGLHSSVSSSSLSRSHERLGEDSGGAAKANASVVSSAKRVSVLPEGWCYVVERHLLPPSVAAALEAEMENVLSGGVDDFFARNPILENDDVIAQDVVARTERARLYGAHVGTSSSSSAVTANKLHLPWVEVCRTRSMIGHVTGLEASPPLLAASSSSSPPPPRLSPRTPSMSKDMGQDSASVVVGDNDEDWPMTAREMKLRKLKKQFETGYLFKPMRFGNNANDGNNSNDGNGATKAGQEAAKKKTAKQGKSSSASPGGSKRRIYVFRSFVESTQDPSVRSAPSALLVTEAPDTSRAVTFSIPKPPIDETDDSVIEEDELYRDSHGVHDNFGEKSEESRLDVKDRPYVELDGPFGDFGDFLNRLEHLVLGSSTHFTSGINSAGDGCDDDDENGRCSRHGSEVDDVNDDDDDNEEVFPIGWQAHWDEARQLPYFSHAASGLVQWRRPEAWHAPTPPEAPQLY